MKYLLGYDVGSSSVKVALLDIETGKALATGTSPDQEMGMIAHEPGWAEQHPDSWWQEAVNATHKLKAKYPFDPALVAGIGISYQMHGLVVVDKDLRPLRPSIIWCDSRAVEIGNHAMDDLGAEYSLHHLLNSPGNFTASKLKWVKDKEPQIFEQIRYFMLPGDYLALRMSGTPQTTVSGLSEGIFWDFAEQKVSQKLLDLYGFDSALIPQIVDTFSPQSQLSASAAAELGLKAGIPIAYRAGDQPNNAFSLNVLNPGEVATTAGTSGVVYGINAQATSDPLSRVNTFAHVNSTPEEQRNGVLLCVNGTGILNSWVRRFAGGLSYDEMNRQAAHTPIGAEGLTFLPFGNGAERVLENRLLGGQLQGINFNRHTPAHVFRAAQEGIVFALQYGLQVMKEMGVQTHTVRAGHANLFLSPLFREAFANTTGATIELYDTDGAQGAARAAGIGTGVFDTKSAFNGLTQIATVEPLADLQEKYANTYAVWEDALKKI
ncbi:xylulokinase [Runella slithyformis]|uniref:Xylulokinase n=1 Tax=Runella slithyformis (strain ATCC 29530 / DSM 19594 / LMG 11500 / NCIMB 11436 / LSU 4) TaxID=761193 RepID=A0A7U3ZHW6_RUNSL|nr:FGGY family carbohydrate kinase [Runella slithyformis]AEI47520.1 Xylulokinase [Runella slithyformis DSM 19594]